MSRDNWILSRKIWSNWKRQLDTLAPDVLPLGSLAAGLVSPVWWDSPPIVVNLCQAWDCFPGDSRWHSGAAAAQVAIAAAKQKQSPGIEPKIQAIAYKHLLAHRFPNGFDKHCSLHIAQLLSLDLDPSSTLDLRESFKVVRSIRKHEAFRVIKTWINSWATSRRYDQGP